MTAMIPKLRRGGAGDAPAPGPICGEDRRRARRAPTIADTIPVAEVMRRDVACVREDLDVDALVDLMIRRSIGCVPVVDRAGAPIGVVTKQDLVEALLGAGRAGAARARVVGELMTPIAFTLDEDATIAHAAAAAVMSVERVHHVPIVGADEAVIGVVSALDIVAWLVSHDGLLEGARAR